ncbi:SepM family pheromone-processing serine protease [Liquorilactobacillus sicerae]|uniref:SepM family pheromone-processing serine protease n=1 Tax=Liquorilactobacillus sicerae TaxID=1416943 RepID=UPI0024808EAA|nr:SepM family pheromone-processing serine protease [Liquorilactobacillus sicerae]
MNKKRSLLITISLLIILAVGFFLPLPVYIESVGSAENVASYVRIANQKDQSKGKLLLTYVQLTHATPVLYLASFFDRNATRLPSSEISGGADDQEFDLIQSYYMKSAVNQAKINALRLTHKHYHQSFKGIYVMSLLAKSDFKDKLKIGDLVTKINNQKFNSLESLITYLGKQQVGKKVKVTFYRNQKSRSVTGKVIPITKKRNGIGVELAAKTVVKSVPKIKTDMDGIGGPSAGLMLALQMYSQLKPVNLKHGRLIAGTGTISSDGKIGQIGGIDKKVIAANRAGAKIFLSPTGSNYRLAKKTVEQQKLKIKLIPVKTFKEAVAALEK